MASIFDAEVGDFDEKTIAKRIVISPYHLLTFLLLDLIFMPSDVVLKALFTPFKNTNMALVYVACGVLLPLMLGVVFDYVKKLAWFHYKKQN